MRRRTRCARMPHDRNRQGTRSRGAQPEMLPGMELLSLCQIDDSGTQQGSCVPHDCGVRWLSRTPPLADPTPLFLPWSTTRRLSIIGGLSVQRLDQCVESARPSDLDRRCWRLLAGRGDGLLGHGGPRLCLEPRPPWRCIAERGPGPRGGLFDNLTQQANAGSSGAVPGKWAIWQAVGQMGSQASKRAWR